MVIRRWLKKHARILKVTTAAVIGFDAVHCCFTALKVACVLTPNMSVLFGGTERKKVLKSFEKAGIAMERTKRTI